VGFVCCNYNINLEFYYQLNKLKEEVFLANEKKYVGLTGLISVINNIKTKYAQIQHAHVKSEIIDFPSIPFKTSELINDSGFKTTDNNTTYTLSKSGDVVTLIGSDDSTSIFVIEKELPTVTTNNEGDFLRVVNGVWAAATIPNAEGASF